MSIVSVIYFRSTVKVKEKASSDNHDESVPASAKTTTPADDVVEISTSELVQPAAANVGTKLSLFCQINYLKFAKAFSIGLLNS